MSRSHFPHASASPVPSGSREDMFTRAQGAPARDASDRTDLESELRMWEAKCAGILAIAVDAIVSVDEDQRIILFNQGAEDIFGYAREEVEGQSLAVLLPERIRAVHERHVHAFGEASVTARHRGERQEIVGRRKDGEEFPAEASISKVEVDGRRLYTVVLRDVTERHLAVAELARYAEELARSNEELERFAYVASHDLQEPLRMVASYTQLLARRYGGRLDADADEFIGYAVDGVNRMRELIDDLLTYSRVGREGRQRGPVDLDKVFAQTLSNLQVVLKESQGEVTRDGLPTVNGDEPQLIQLFQNLIGNALKFRGTESPRVHVGVEKGHDGWTLSVSDNGIGFDLVHQERAFTVFQRLHNRQDYPGTGIGLAIARKVVERHGGRIWAESEPGKGSTFRFTLREGS